MAGVTKQNADLDFLSAARVLNLLDAVDPQEPCTLAQALSFINKQAWKDDVLVKAPTNVNLASPGTAIDGVTLTGTPRILLASQTDQKENGIYQWNGSAVAMTRTIDADTGAELESALVPVSQGTSAGTQWRQTTANVVLGTSNVVFANNQGAAPAASETTAGIAEIATQTETNTGTDDLRMVTPLKLASYTGFTKKKNFTNIGDGSATQIDLTHNLGTTDVTVRPYLASGGATYNCQVSTPDGNTVRLNFAVAPASNLLKCAVVG